MKPRDIEHVLSVIVRKLVHGYRPEKILLFGSYAYGSPRSGSDIDLLIVKDTKKRGRERRIEVRKILDTPLGFPIVETIVITPAEMRERLELTDHFIETIVAKGRVIYDRAAS
ncbi:MAG: nucleotidyltransferase domain-containing protein [Candidatus Thermoplasmatota archaeon]